MPPSEQARWFAEEVQPHEPMLRAFLRKEFPALSDVDDVVQESHLRVLKARELGKIASVKAYLFATARNCALQFFRRRKHLSELSVSELPELAVLESSHNVVETVSARQDLALVTDAIDTLPGRCREIVVLRALHGLSHKEIAARLGLSEQTVRVQVMRGMRKCAQFLREADVMKEGRT
jgi:RNA polymerase sigma-70 factor (ECF subfamily)